MPSTSYRHWRTVRASALDEIAHAHAAVGGTARGRRYTTQQINRAYAMLLASQFQGYWSAFASKGTFGAKLEQRQSGAGSDPVGVIDSSCLQSRPRDAAA
jgi:hypothetical protein